MLEVESPSASDECSIALGSRILPKEITEKSNLPEHVLTVPLLGLPASCDLEVFGKMNHKLGNVIIERAVLPAPIGWKGPRPLMLTSVGRSGSTLFMQLLGAHPEIAVHLKYPMEAKIARKRFQEILTRLPRLCLAPLESMTFGEASESQLLDVVASLAHNTAMEVGRCYQVPSSRAEWRGQYSQVLRGEKPFT